MKPESKALETNAHTTRPFELFFKAIYSYTEKDFLNSILIKVDCGVSLRSLSENLRSLKDIENLKKKTKKKKTVK